MPGICIKTSQHRNLTLEKKILSPLLRPLDHESGALTTELSPHNGDDDDDDDDDDDTNGRLLGRLLFG